MITALARIVTDFFLKYKAINNEDADIYQYGNEIIISSVIDLLIVFILGLIYKELLNAVLFFISFLLLRTFGGGYHANTYLKCKIIYIIDISVVLFLSKYAVFIYNLHTMILISMFSTTVIFFLAPIENPNKPLSESETVKNARKSKVLSVILCLMIIVLYRINKEISLTLLLTYFSAAAAMIIEYLRKVGTVHEDQKENG